MASVEEYAAWRDVSAQRVRKLLRAGDLPGHRVGARQWVVDDAAFSARPRLGPPMSPPMAWALIALLSGDRVPSDIPPVRHDRLKRNRDRLLQAGDEAPALISSWLRHRGERLVFRVQPDDLADLLADERVMRSGISDERSGLSSGDVAEIWLRDFSQLDELQGDYLLLPHARGNVILRRGREHREAQAPLGLVIADLADWNGPREDGRVVEMLSRI